MYFLRNTAYALKTKVVGKSTEDILEELTSPTDENLNIPTRILQEVAEKSFNDAEYDVIVKYIWRQFSANERPWRKMLKTLNLVEYLLKNGSPRFIDDTREEIYHIRLLSRFCQMENNEDKGGPIRDRATKIDEMLNDTTLIDQERRKADAERRKLKSLGLLGGTATTTTSLPAKTYQGFSSEDMNTKTPSGAVVHPKSESDDEIQVSDDEPEKETNDMEENGVVKSDMINTINIAKDQHTITELIDFGDFQTSASTGSIDKTPVNSLKEITESVQNQQQEAAQPSPIWNWDQKPYNKWNEPQQTTDEFDWNKAPSSENLDNTEKFYKKSEIAQVQDENVSNSNLTTQSSDDVKPVNEMFNQKEINMVDLGDMKEYTAKSKEVVTGLSDKQEIDDLFDSMSMKSIPVSHGQQYFNGFANL